jgi:hypothetical protein
MDDDFDLHCPKCGTDEVSYGYSAPPFVANVECHADGCEVVAVGQTEDEVQSLWRSGEWTHELVGRDDFGEATYKAKGQSDV